MFGGQAERNANTFEGRLQRLRLRFDEMVETIGYKVLPFFTDLVTKITDLVDAFGEQGAAGAIRVLRAQLQNLARSNDGTINSFGTLINALVTVRNAVATVLNAFIRLYNVIPILDDIPTINKLEQLGTNIGDFYKAFSGATQAAEAQRKLNTYMGPVASRNVEELGKFQDAYRDSLIGTADAEEDVAAASGGGTKKIKDKTKALQDAKKATDDYAKALEGAIEGVRDQFSPALKEANDRLAESQRVYDDFRTSIRDSVAQVFDLGAAWREAADSEGAKSFFDVLKNQAARANDLAFNLAFLVNQGLDDPNLLRQIVSAGTDTGLEISNALIAGGKEGLQQLKDLSSTVNQAADYVAKLSADKWYKTGVDQAQRLVDGINALISDTEFALKFTVTVEGANQLGGMFGSNAATIMGGGTAAPMFNPADFSAAAFMALGQSATRGQVSTSSVNINVNGGDPNAVVGALRTYMQRNGSVPIKVTG
jgi:hypothetical protein